MGRRLGAAGARVVTVAPKRTSTGAGMTKGKIMRGAGAAASVAALIGAAAPARALECPVPQSASRPGVIKEAPVQIVELAPMLGGGDVAAEVPKIVDALRKRYPKAHPAEIVNTLIAAYCPAVQQAAGLSEAQKTARVEDFSKAVLAVLY